MSMGEDLQTGTVIFPTTIFNGPLRRFHRITTAEVLGRRKSMQSVAGISDHICSVRELLEGQQMAAIGSSMSRLKSEWSP
jgi:hypothetical protein